MLRSVLAAVFVTAAIAVASALNSRWAGIMVGFPMTMLPTIVILLRSYETSIIHAFLRNFPFGMGSIIVFLASVPLTFSSFGVSLGIVVSIALSRRYTQLAPYGCLGIEQSSPPNRRSGAADLRRNTRGGRQVAGLPL